MRTSLFVTVAIAAAIAAPALAQDAADTSAPLSGSIENSATYNSASANLTSSHQLKLDLAVPVSGDVTLGAKLITGLSGDLGAGTVSLDDPMLVLRLESLVAGTFKALDVGSALDYNCIDPSPGSTHFGTADLLLVGTCYGYGGGQSLLYSSPSFGGVSVTVSATADLKNVAVIGTVDQSVSALLGYSGDVGGMTLDLSAGFARALTLKGGGGPLPTALQAGAQLSADDWSVGAAAQVELNSLIGGTSWGLGVGGSKELGEHLWLAAEAAIDSYQNIGVATTEYSLGATAEYEVIADTLWLDAGANVVRTVGGGVDTVSYSLGTGVSYAF